MKYSKSVDASEQTMAKNLIPLILVTVGFGLVGFVDDFKVNFKKHRRTKTKI